MKTIRILSVWLVGECVCVFDWFERFYSTGEEEISDNLIFSCVGFSLHSFKTWRINLWYICECVSSTVLFFSLSVCGRRAKSRPTRGDQVQANRKAVFFFVCSYWLNCFVCFVYFVWIIYYYYYSIINSEIKKRSLQKKKENVGAFLFCFVLLDFFVCFEENQENRAGSLNSANITNDNFFSLVLVRYQLGINQ